MSLILQFNEATVKRGLKKILGPLNLSIYESERWVILGPNGAGKTTFFQLAGTVMHPTTGRVSVLGEELGKVDVFELRPRIGLMTNSTLENIPYEESVMDVVLTSAYAIYGTWSTRFSTTHIWNVE